MAGGDKRIKIGDDGVDRITELPVHLREHILEFLNLDDAVATSVLSSRWRYCWTGLRKLDFDWDFWYHCGTFENVEDVERTRAVDRVFLLHDGPIREFLLDVPAHVDNTLDINVWLLVMSKKGVRKIEIDASEYDDHSFPIPSCLFHCRELEKLGLCICKMTLPRDFNGYSNLTGLWLNNVDIATSEIGRLISSCPLLEKLSLKFLMHESPLVLEALNLKTFYSTEFDLENIIFKDIPKLSCVTLLAAENFKLLMDTPRSYSTLDRVSSMYMIEELTFDFSLLESIPENYPSSTSTPLENLKSLTMRAVDLCSPDDVRFTLCLLNSAPDLKNLTIILHTDSKIRFEKNKEQIASAILLESELKKDANYNSIQTMKILGIHGIPHEKLLIELLKKRCQKVKNMIVEKGYWKIHEVVEDKGFKLI